MPLHISSAFHSDRAHCQELYEPLWDDLHTRTAQSGIRIRSIWIADMWNQGQSGVLNEKILGNDRETRRGAGTWD